MDKPILDINGSAVVEGSKVKLLSIPDSLLSILPEDEVKDLTTMIGEIFEVYEIDEWGGVWVQKWFNEGEEKTNSHSLSLESHEMELMKFVKK